MSDETDYAQRVVDGEVTTIEAVNYVRGLGADPEVDHGFVDDLMLSALRAIADGHTEPRELARCVVAMEAAVEFERWYA